MSQDFHASPTMNSPWLKLEAELEELKSRLPAPANSLNAKQIAEHVLKLSDFYIHSPSSSSPWHEPWARNALFSYFHPLNLTRVFAAGERGRHLGFFSGLDHLYDLGSGSGAAAQALSLHHNWKSLELRDVSSAILEFAVKISQLPTHTRTTSARLEVRPPQLANPETSLAVLANVLTENTELPAWVFDLEALMIVEPSTREDSRRLQARREELFAQGFHIWAPCPHAKPCPLLRDERDWCHDAIDYPAPSWWSDLESHLPMKNSRLTYSYLLARKSSPPVSQNSLQLRVVGDVLAEKGKSRALSCFDGERAFLSWFPQRRKAAEPNWCRGDLLAWPSDPNSFEKRGQEDRLEYRIAEADFPLLSKLPDKSESDR
jgi:hypothetical protein